MTKMSSKKQPLKKNSSRTQPRVKFAIINSLNTSKPVVYSTKSNNDQFIKANICRTTTLSSANTDILSINDKDIGSDELSSNHGDEIAPYFNNGTIHLSEVAPTPVRTCASPSSPIPLQPNYANIPSLHMSPISPIPLQPNKLSLSPSPIPLQPNKLSFNSPSSISPPSLPSLASTTLGLPEYLAFTDQPLNINHLLTVQNVPLSSKPLTSEGRRDHYQLSSTSTTKRLSPKFQSLPNSIHQFCLGHNLPQLPLELQIFSRKTHSLPVSSEYNYATREKVEEQKERGKARGGEASLEVCGMVIPSEKDPMRLLWAPAPPKLALHPLTVKSQLFPYHQEPVIHQHEADIDELVDSVKEPKRRLFTRQSTVSDYESSSLIIPESLPDVDVIIQSNDIEQSHDSYEIYKKIMEEIKWQREQLMESYLKKKELEAKDNELAASASQESGGNTSYSGSNISMVRRAIRQRKAVHTSRHHIKRTNSAIMRSLYVRTELSKVIPPLTRTLSLTFNSSIYNQQNVPRGYHSRTNSLPSALDFEALMNHYGGSINIEDPYKWSECLWDRWFYEVLAEVRAAIAEMERGPQISWSPHVNKRMKTDKSSKKEKPPITRNKSVIFNEVELIEICPLSSIDIEVMQAKLDEVTNQIESVETQENKTDELGELLVYRSCLYRQIGRLNEALDDINRSLTSCPLLVQPHWDKHVLLLIQGKEKLAIDELTLLLKKDKKHALGFISKGMLLAKRGHISAAIQSISQAILFEPNNPQLHFIRGELREKRGETEGAMSDYSVVVKLQPNNEEALIRQARHKFNKHLWVATTQTLTTLLAVNHRNTDAWVLRSQAYLNMDKHLAALQDLSAAIHLNPHNALLFYQRGCLIRKQDPERALLDFSTSILIDSSNAIIYLHRGITYIQLKCYDEALHDFIRASQIDPTLASAHTNIGLVHMLYKQNYKVAINYFTTGLTADPVYTRALLCRAEAYTKLGQLHESILDWSRAIHITPDDPTLHLSQGNVYFLLKDYDNAVNCMRIASKLDCEIKSSLTQKALVHSFLGYHEKSISILQQSGLKTIHGRKLYIILGKVQMRAKLYHEASVSFKEALRVLRYMHLSASDEMALTSELHYLCGICFYKCGKLHEATEEFSHVIRIDPTHVLGHYHRGLSLLKQGNNKGMFAINYALMLKSDLIEAYLTRAAYYGSNGRLPKAIMNCTEAINIEPETVRGYLYRGVLRYLMKYNEAAINDLTQAISLNPSNCWIPLFNRAICYTEVENIAEALTNYSTICLMDETPNYKVMINRGLLYLHMEDYYNSLMDLLTANKSITKDPSLYQAIAYCYHKLGDFEKAIYYYTQAITIQPSFIEAYISRGNVYTDYLTPEGNRKAKTDYVKVLHQWPSCLPAHVNLSLLLQCEGQHMMAWKHMTSLLSLNKDYTPALEARSMISFQMGNTFGALLDISEALRYDVNPQYYTERGAIHQYIGDSRNAVLDYERALHLDPNYPLAHYNLGNILLQQGLYKQASQRYTAVINIVPNDDSALINRALCYTAIGEKELALMDLNKAIICNPYASHAYLNRGNLLRADNRLQEAEYDYCKAVDLQPDDALSRYYYGEVLSLLGKKAEAHEQFFKSTSS